MCSNCAQTGHTHRDRKCPTGYTPSCVNCKRRNLAHDHHTLFGGCPIRKEALRSIASSNITQGTTENSATAPQRPAVVPPTPATAPRQQQETQASIPPLASTVTREETLIITALTIDARLSCDNDPQKYRKTLTESMKNNFNVNVQYPLHPQIQEHGQNIPQTNIQNNQAPEAVAQASQNAHQHLQPQTQEHEQNIPPTNTQSSQAPNAVTQTPQNVHQRTNPPPQTSTINMETISNFVFLHPPSPLSPPHNHESRKRQRTAPTKTKQNNSRRKRRARSANNSNSITTNTSFPPEPITPTPHPFTSTPKPIISTPVRKVKQASFDFQVPIDTSPSSSSSNSSEGELQIHTSSEELPNTHNQPEETPKPRLTVDNTGNKRKLSPESSDHNNPRNVPDIQPKKLAE